MIKKIKSLLIQLIEPAPIEYLVSKKIIEKNNPLSPEEQQIKELSQQLKKIEGIVGTAFNEEKMYSFLDRSRIFIGSIHGDYSSQKNTFNMIYGTSFNFIMKASVGGNLLTMYKKGEFFKHFHFKKPDKWNPYSRHSQDPHDFFFQHRFITTSPSMRKTSIDEFKSSDACFEINQIERIYTHNNQFVHNNEDTFDTIPVTTTVTTTVYNLFLSHLTLFLIYANHYLDSKEYTPFFMDVLMQHKDVLSLIARLIQMSEDEEVVNAFLQMNENTLVHAENMFRCLEPFVSEVESSIASYKEHKRHLEEMKQRRKEIELKSKIDYYGTDSLSIDKEKADQSIRELLEKAERFSQEERTM